ncbi:hypothetical protein RYX36_002034 [Vicia faba]
MANLSLILLSALALSFSLVFATDPSTLQDFCVTNPIGQGNSVCKDPKLVEANDFFFSGLHIAANTTNPSGSRVTPVFASQLPGYGNVVAIAALSSQNPGVITIGNAVFGATPEIFSGVLTKAFQLDKNTINYLHSKF